LQESGSPMIGGSVTPGKKNGESGSVKNHDPKINGLSLIRHNWTHLENGLGLGQA